MNKPIYIFKEYDKGYEQKLVEYSIKNYRFYKVFDTLGCNEDLLFNLLNQQYESFDLIILTSKRASQQVAKQMDKLSAEKLEVWRQKHYFFVGKKSSLPLINMDLNNIHISDKVIDGSSLSIYLLNFLALNPTLKTKEILYLTTENNLPTLQQNLELKGYKVHKFICYKTEINQPNLDEILGLDFKGCVLVLFSPSFVDLVIEKLLLETECTIVTVGNTTKGRVEKLQGNVDFVMQTPNIDGLIDVLKLIG